MSLAPRAWVAAAATGTVAFLFSAPARAWDADVTSDTSAQFYDVRSPTGETVLNRRRLTSMLGVGAYNLLDAPPGDAKSPELTFRARLRYDADYGASPDSSDPTKLDSVVPGFQSNAVDLMYGYVEGRRFFSGLLGFKLGRQYVTDALGWWSFDGGEVSVTTPYYVKLEAYGGLEQRGGMPLSTARFERDGIWRGDRASYDPSLYPQFQPSAIAPAFGVAVESAGVTWLHSRLTYRRVYDTGGSNVTDFTSGVFAPASYSGTRISSERIGYALDLNLATVGGFKAGVVYDLYYGGITSLTGSLEGYLGKKVTLAIDYDMYVPTFDADSIWNFFAAQPMDDIGLRGNVNVTDNLSVAASGHVKIYTVETQNDGETGGATPSPFYSALATFFPGNGHPFDEGGTLAARWRTGETHVALQGAGNWGDEGDRAGADLSAEHVFETRYVARARAGVWQWDDKIRPDRDATSFNYVAGLGYRFAPRSQAMVDWEQDMNRLVGQRFRLMLSLNLAVSK